MATTGKWVGSLLALWALGGCTLVGVAPPPAPVPEAPVEVEVPPPQAPVPEPAVAPPVPPAPPVVSPVIPPEVVEDPREIRALWVVRTALIHPDSIRNMVHRAANAGFNTLLVQVRGRGDAFYRGGPEPRSILLERAGQDFDPLATVIREARARGLDVHAWVNIHLVSSAVTLPTDPGHLVLRHPEWLAVPRSLALELASVEPSAPAFVARLAAHARENITRVEGLYTSPTHPGVADHVVAIWRHVLMNYELDGVHLDYIRYAAPDYDYSRATTRAFRDWMAADVPGSRREQLDRAAIRDPLAWPDAFPVEFGEFRRQGVTRLMERVAAESRSLRPGIRVTAAVFPDVAEARRDRFQDWGAWLRDGVLDAVVPMSYTSDEARYRQQIRGATAVVGGGRVWAGVGIYQTTFQGAVRKVEIAREEGAAGFALFSYDWAVAEGGRVSGGVYLDDLSRQVFTGR